MTCKRQTGQAEYGSRNHSKDIKVAEKGKGTSMIEGQRDVPRQQGKQHSPNHHIPVVVRRVGVAKDDHDLHDPAGYEHHEPKVHCSACLHTANSGLANCRVVTSDKHHICISPAGLKHRQVFTQAHIHVFREMTSTCTCNSQKQKSSYVPYDNHAYLYAHTLDCTITQT